MKIQKKPRRRSDGIDKLRKTKWFCKHQTKPKCLRTEPATTITILFLHFASFDFTFTHIWCSDWIEWYRKFGSISGSWNKKEKKAKRKMKLQMWLAAAAPKQMQPHKLLDSVIQSTAKIRFCILKTQINMAHDCLMKTTDQVMQVLWDSIIIYTAISDPKSVCIHWLLRRESGLNKNMFGIAITIIASKNETMTQQAAPSTIPLAYCDSRRRKPKFILEEPIFDQPQKISP